MRILAILMCVLFAKKIVGQHNPTLHVNHLVNNKTLILNENYLVEKDTIQIQTLKYYISEICFLLHNKIVWKEKNSYHLVDEENIQTKNISLNRFPTNIQFDAIQLNIGIDSKTNADGIKGDDLDPTKGMYWTWQNGYINFKIEGKSSVCKTRNNQFQFHIGGYQFPFATMQTITLPCTKNDIFVDVHLEKIFKKIDLKNQNQIMQPCNEAVILSQKLATIFSIQ